MAFPIAVEVSTVLRGGPDSGLVCVPEAVAAQAALRPAAAAVVAGDALLTYSELNYRADRVARRLHSLGVGTDVPVGLCLPRSPEMVVAALAAMKAGGAYAPMDPDDPPVRLNFVLDDSRAPVLVTNSRLAGQFQFPRNKMVIMDSTEITSESDDTWSADVQPGDIAYVIYTSGSTGKPKGVELTHKGLSNLVSWHQQAFSVTPQDRASHLAGLSFDAAVWEIWPYLAAGASLHLAPDDTRTSPERLRDWLVEHEITISFIPTPIAERMLSLSWPKKTKLRMLLTGGDRLQRYPPPLLPFRVINNYGPTECTVVATSGEIRPGGPGRPGAGPLRADGNGRTEALPSIGEPIANTRIYLLDQDGQPVPSGSPGEMYIGGPSLARGYRNQPELTSEKFVPDPFHERPSQFMFRTGDLARLLPGGQIEFLGRLDDQIKIRGYRIEPGEIIATLHRHPSVREALVVAREDASAEPRLVCYLVLQPGAKTTAAELREFLRAFLPDYMIPSAFISLEAFVLTTHGKIDRTALPSPETRNMLADEGSAERPLTSTERRIADIAAGLLNQESVGVDDNFFLLGGHSLLGAQLIARMRETFGIEIPLRTLFGAPTVAELAREIEGLASSSAATTGEAA